MEKKKLTAAEARQLSGPSIEERVDEALVLIKTQAEKKQRQANLHDKFWTHGGYGTTAEWKQAKKMLEDLGYDVSFYYDCKQFVDMYTVVKW